MLTMISGIPVQLTRKRIKTLRLTVSGSDGTVRLSAPWFAPAAQLAAFVEKNRDWIARQQSRAAASAPAAMEYLDGDGVYLWGRRYTLRLRESGRSAVALAGEELVLSFRPGSAAAQREKLMTEWYRARLKEAVAQYLPKWEAITGLHCDSWQSKNMRTRWGTCNVKTRKLWLNVQLAKMPEECLEYVILHELAHLRVSDHGARFKAILDAYMPDWRRRRKQLNDFAAAVVGGAP